MERRLPQDFCSGLCPDTFQAVNTPIVRNELRKCQPAPACAHWLRASNDAFTWEIQAQSERAASSGRPRPPSPQTSFLGRTAGRSAWASKRRQRFLFGARRLSTELLPTSVESRTCGSAEFLHHTGSPKYWLRRPWPLPRPWPGQPPRGQRLPRPRRRRISPWELGGGFRRGR